MGSMHLEEAADLIIQRALDKGIIIHRYDAVTSKSIYIKFDYGVANSLRISDHDGYGHLKYRFNLLDTRRGKKVINDTHPRFYYGMDAIDILLRDIMQSRNDKMKSFGDKYYTMMAKDRVKQRKGATKFWRGAKLIGEDMRDELTRAEGINDGWFVKDLRWWDTGREETK